MSLADYGNLVKTSLVRSCLAVADLVDSCLPLSAGHLNGLIHVALEIVLA